MQYLSLKFYIFLLLLLAAYYAMPKNRRYAVLLLGSIVFYVSISGSGIFFLALAAAAGFFGGLLIDRAASRIRRRAYLFFSSVLCLSPLLIIRASGFFSPSGIIVPLGISFYTLQIISYLADVYLAKIKSEKNVLIFSLFVSFFPQIVQGPIPRYGALAAQLREGHSFDEGKFVRGFQLILWGFFLKYMIADKAGIFVSAVFASPENFSGAFSLAAGILYSVQLYADFYACTCISRGVSRLFGIELARNFDRPYFACGIKYFWRRWHMSLSGFLRDYIYIPLGGGRKGALRKYINIMLTFLASGLWHGGGLTFIFWGALHGIYQICEDILFPSGKREKRASAAVAVLSRAVTFFLVMLAWIVFRADSLSSGLYMIGAIFTDFDFSSLLTGEIFALGLRRKEFLVLFISILILFLADFYGRDSSVGGRISSLPLPVRWAIYLAAISAIWIFGTYGFGFDAQAFIYGGF